MIAGITQNATTLLDLTNVSVRKAIIGTEENVKVCKWFPRVIETSLSVYSRLIRSCILSF